MSYGLIMEFYSFIYCKIHLFLEGLTGSLLNYWWNDSRIQCDFSDDGERSILCIALSPCNLRAVTDLPVTKDIRAVVFTLSILRHFIL